MVRAFSWALAALGLTMLGVSHATATTNPQPGCPTPVSVTNGGFESGKFAPWADEGPQENAPQVKIISPGYKGKHAVQFEFAAANQTYYSVAQQTNGKECWGYYYTVSFAWNWVKYTGPVGNGPTFCRFEVLTGYTNGTGTHYATKEPGWHYHSYLARNIYSCRPAYAEFIVDVHCQGGSEVLPSFTLLMDHLDIQNAPGSPNPLPTGPCF